MSFTGLNPENGKPKKPSVLRDELQHVLGVAVPDCILKNDDKTYGGEITPSTGTTISLSALKALIGRKYHRKDTATDLVLPIRRALLIYALKNSATDSVEPSFGYKEAQLPDIDTNTVALWDFRNWDGTSAIPNSAVGVNGNTIAVANPVTKNGTVSKVDGWLGYAAQGDGSTGYLVSSNSTGFPVGSSEKEANALYTRNANSSSETIFSFGNSDASATFNVIVSATGEILVSIPSGSSAGTGYIMDAGRTYLVTHQHDGSYSYIYINGVLVAKVANAISPVAAVMQILRNVNNANYSKGVIHFIELRNKMRTSVQLGASANKLCLPCSYTSYTTGGSKYPIASSMLTNNGLVSFNASGVTDGNIATNGFHTDNLSGGTQNFVVDLGIGVAKQFTQFKFYHAGTTNGLFKIRYSDNGTDWTDCSNVFGVTVGWNTIPLSTLQAHRFYQFLLTNSTGTGAYFNEIEFWEKEVSEKKDIREILPADSISLGRVITGSTALKEIRMDYQDGRREGATGGNRIVFLDWKYFSAVNTPVSWNLPFGNADYKISEVIVTDTLNVPGRYSYQTLNPAKVYSTGFYGLYQIDSPDRSKLTLSCEGGGVGYFGNFKTSGFYAALVAEVIE